MLVCMLANKAKQRQTSVQTSVSRGVDDVNIARGVSKTRHECGSQDTCDTIDEACDIVRLRRDQFKPFIRVVGGMTRVQIGESFVCRSKAAAAVVIARVNAVLSELDGYKLP